MNKVMFAGLALAAVLAVNTGSSFAAASENVKNCATQWDALKTANKVPAGATWPSFEKDCVAKLEAAAVVPTAPAPKVAAPAPAPAAPKAAVVTTAADNEKNCAGQWAQMSTIKKVTTGATWDKFKVDCMAKLTTAAVVAPPAPAVPAAKGAATPAATGGTAGEQSRIKKCATQWDAMKVANKVPAGLKWPQFWHQCDVEMKASGQ